MTNRFKLLVTPHYSPFEGVGMTQQPISMWRSANEVDFGKQRFEHPKLKLQMISSINR